MQVINQVSSFALSNIKGELVAILVLYLLAVTSVFAIGATFRGHVQI